MTLIPQNKWRVRMCGYFVSRVWAKVSLKVGLLVRNYVLGILHYVIFPITGPARTGMILQKSDTDGMWREWTEKNLPRLISKQSGKNWTFDYIRSAFESGNSRTILLLPFIFMLKITAPPVESPSPESSLMYTLY